MVTYYKGGGAILDRSVYSDVVFANVCTKEGYITSEGNFFVTVAMMCSCNNMRTRKLSLILVL